MPYNSYNNDFKKMKINSHEKKIDSYFFENAEPNLCSNNCEEFIKLLPYMYNEYNHSLVLFFCKYQLLIDKTFDLSQNIIETIFKLIA